MPVASTAFHVLGVLGRAAGKVFLWFFGLLVVAGGAVEGIAAANHTTGFFTHIAAAAVGLLAGYAAAITVILSEAIRFLIRTIQTIQRELRGVGGERRTTLERVAQEGSGRSAKPAPR